MIIYHLLPVAVWQAQPIDQPYPAATLASEGFMHCTREKEMLVQVANRFYQQIPGDFVILCIDTALVRPEIRWEEADGHLFPHIYGPLNREAIVDIHNFPRNPKGEFLPFS